MPFAEVEVEMDAPALRWRGAGYVDQNAGAEPLEHGFSRWTWSRAATSRGATILYDADRRRGPPLSLALSFDAKGGVRDPTSAAPGDAFADALGARAGDSRRRRPSQRSPVVGGHAVLRPQPRRPHAVRRAGPVVSREPVARPLRQPRRPSDVAVPHAAAMTAGERGAVKSSEPADSVKPPVGKFTGRKSAFRGKSLISLDTRSEFGVKSGASL